MRLAACLLALAGAGVSQTRYPVDWNKLSPEILEKFTTLLKIDTSNPPGNETKAAKAIQAMLARDGISSQLFALEPARANLVARIRASGGKAGISRKRPLLLMGHTDVVGVERNRWTVEPFGAIRKNGFIYARGAVDDKIHVVAGVMILLLLHRLRVELDRDVIFLAEAGEEGSARVGIEFMAERHWPEIDAEYALAEGGSAVEKNGAVHHVLISVTEKLPRGVHLVAHGTAGHASQPAPDNPIVHLAEAVSRVGKWQTPRRLNAAARIYFERMAAISPPEEAARYRGILDPARAPKIDAYFREHEPGHYSILHTTAVPTMLNGGFRTNVIPSEAEAFIDVRALPGEDMTRFVADLGRVIGDPAVEVIPSSAPNGPEAPPSRIDTEMYRVLEDVSRRMFHAPVIPTMLTGATDNARLRTRGVQAYGVGPIMPLDQDPPGGAHGEDERIAERSVQAFVEFLWNVVIGIAAK